MNKKRGFTIPELMIAMSFLSMLLIVLLLSTMNIISIYNKGLTLKRVNQSGASIGATMQKSLRNAGEKRIYLQVSTPSGDKPIGFCNGEDSYVWSLYDTAGTDPIVPIKYDDDSIVGFTKIKDGGEICGSGGVLPDAASIGVVNKATSTELLGDGLVMKQPTFFQSPGDGKLISFIYTISTSNNDSDFADPPTGSGSLVSATCKGGKAQGDDFCALNTFVITSYAGYNKN